MTISEQITKDLEVALAGDTAKLKEDFGQIRGNRPSPDMIQDIRLSLYDQQLSIRELGSLSVLPPRTIQITDWDPGAIPRTPTGSMACGFSTKACLPASTAARR